MKLRVLNQFGASEPLNSPDEIEVHFPYEVTDKLVKRMTYGHVKILNDYAGELEVNLTPFEIQGLPVCEKQNILVKLISGTKCREAVFSRCLNVRSIEIEGVQRKVII